MAQSIRIRLKAFDHEIIDQSTKKIVETVTRPDCRHDQRRRWWRDLAGYWRDHLFTG